MSTLEPILGTTDEVNFVLAMRLVSVLERLVEISAAILVLAAIVGTAFACFARLMTRTVYGQIGQSRCWHMTFEHGHDDLSPHCCWSTAINVLSEMNAEFVREWGSHAEVGDRANREYRLDGTTVLLELDRWNGFTLSGDPVKLEPVAYRLQQESQRQINSQ